MRAKIIPEKDGKEPDMNAPREQPLMTQAKLADMVFRAKLRRLEFETRQGKLIEAAIVAVPDKPASER